VDERPLRTVGELHEATNKLACGPTAPEEGTVAAERIEPSQRNLRSGSIDRFQVGLFG
jgi:hypothetical protein